MSGPEWTEKSTVVLIYESFKRSFASFATNIPWLSFVIGCLNLLLSEFVNRDTNINVLWLSATRYFYRFHTLEWRVFDISFLFVGRMGWSWNRLVLQFWHPTWIEYQLGDIPSLNQPRALTTRRWYVSITGTKLMISYNYQFNHPQIAS